MTEITDLFESLISQHRAIDIADSEFKKMIYEDPDLREAYREWCRIEGHTERSGFIEYYTMRLDQEDSIWDVLADDYE